MTKKYQNKYRIESARKKGYDYSQNGAYFITIVTKNRECFFGDIVNTPNLGVSTTGKIAQKYWDEIPRHFPFIRLDEMVVMPNHIHGILWIDRDAVSVETPNLGVSTVQQPTNLQKNPFWYIIQLTILYIYYLKSNYYEKFRENHRCTSNIIRWKYRGK